MPTHRASRYGNKKLFVGSDECIKPPDATGHRRKNLFFIQICLLAPPSDCGCYYYR